MKKISTQQLVGILDETRGAAMVGVIAVTDPYGGKPLKSRRRALLIADGVNTNAEAKVPNPFLDPNLPGGHALRKVQRGHAMMNCHYNKAVERRLARTINAERIEDGQPPLEGETLAAAIDERFRKGDNWQQVVTRDDGSLTPFAEHKGTGERYLRTMFYRLVGDAVYVDVRTGETFAFKDIEDVLPVHSPAKNQGLPVDEQVRYNVWKMDGVRGIRLGGEAYRVRPPHEVEAEEVFAALNNFLEQIDIPQPPSADEVAGT